MALSVMHKQKYIDLPLNRREIRKWRKVTTRQNPKKKKEREEKRENFMEIIVIYLVVLHTFVVDTRLEAIMQH